MRNQSNSILYQNFIEIQHKIEEIAEEVDLMSYLQYRESFNKNIFSNGGHNMYNSNDSEHKTLDKFHINLASTKLPEIKLPAFDGSYNQ